MKLYNITDEEMNLVMDIHDNYEEEFRLWSDKNESQLMKWYDENESQGMFDCRFALYCSKQFMEWLNSNVEGS